MRDPQAPIALKDRDRRVTFTDVKIGGGTFVAQGRGVDFHYIMRLADGSVVEDSHGGGKPWSVELGDGKMLRSIEDGMVGMRPGGVRRISVPSYLAFGAHGVGKQIPPDADLDVEVEVLKVY